MKEKTASSALPIYLAALMWPLYALIFPLYRPVHFAGAAVLSLVVGLIAGSLCRAPKPNPEAQVEAQPAEAKAESTATGNPELDKMLADGEKALAEMRRLNDNIKD